MNGAIMIVGVTIYFIVAYFLYGKFLEKFFGIDPKRKTPAHTQTDGVDYVPTAAPVLFGHHFASIAGAGPIIGPIVAAYFGWLPALLWILIGSVFIGAFHDFAALFLSVRHGGRSIGHVVEEQLGYAGRQIFLIFCWSALILVIATFGHVVAATFIKIPAVATASLFFIAMAPIFGWLVSRKKVSLWLGSLIFVPLLFVFIWVGTLIPLDLVGIFGCTKETARTVWLIILFFYVFFASICPVWLLLQPRDYLNSYLLYAMIVFGLVGMLSYSPTLELPAFVGWIAEDAKGNMKNLFPILFVTIACGACSGFHALVSSGTTSKQISNERHILPVGYGGMLVEGVLAVMALISVAYLNREGYVKVMGGSAAAAFSQGLATFATKIGVDLKIGTTFVALAVSAFLLTTLDTATRLARFVWQELFLPRTEEETATPATGLRACIGNRWVATLISVALSAVLVFTPARAALWPVFGASNQLLAALTFLTITLYCIQQKKNCLITFIPMLFIMVVSGWALIVMMRQHWGSNPILFIASLTLFVMAVILSILSTLSLIKAKKRA